MEISSDSQSEKEFPKNDFNIEEIYPNDEQFLKAAKNVFCEYTNPISEDELNEETLYFLPKNNLFLEKENKNLYVLNDDYNIQNHIKGVFQLFHKWSQEYNYNQLYSKDLVFKINNQEPQKRKNMADNMRKRIKSDFCDKILKNLNAMLEPLNLKFCNLSQSEITNVAKEENGKVLKMTLKEFILYRPFDIFPQKEGKKEKDIANWEKNKKILEFLENNQDIYKKLNLENILNTEMKDLYNEYLASDEFQKSIEELKDEGNYFEYIKNYMITAKNVVDFYNA